MFHDEVETADEDTEHDWDTIMLRVWMGVFAICTVTMPINVYMYVSGRIDEKTLILITLILSYIALQLAAATGIVAAIGARRVKQQGEDNQEGNNDMPKPLKASAPATARLLGDEEVEQLVAEADEQEVAKRKKEQEPEA